MSASDVFNGKFDDKTKIKQTEKELIMALAKSWENTVNEGITDPAWDEYDVVIEKEVQAYNLKFGGKPGYKQVNWKLIKAMLWVESGGPHNKEWKTRPLQIGVGKDPALKTLKEKKELSDLVMSDDLHTQIKKGAADNKPEINIKAGIAYLFTRMINEVESKPKDQKIKEYTVKKGEGLEKVAQNVNTTEEELLVQNNIKKGAIIKEGQILKYREAKLEPKNWRSFEDAKIVAARYNGGGDKNYAEKLQYVMKEVFPKVKRK